MAGLFAGVAAVGGVDRLMGCRASPFAWALPGRTVLWTRTLSSS
jgi:hypothetical protein